MQKTLREKSWDNKQPSRKSIVSHEVASTPAFSSTSAFAKDDTWSENDISEDIKDIIKDGEKVKSYIKLKFGLFENVNAFIVEKWR